MLTVTEAAARAINSLVADNNMPESAGLRISRQGDSTRSQGLELSIAAKPTEEESIIETSGAKVFLPPNLVSVLDDQQLDVEQIDEDGEETLNFTLDKQAKSGD